MTILLLIGLALALLAALVNTSDPHADTLRRIRRDAQLTGVAMPTRTPTPTATGTPTATLDRYAPIAQR